MAENQEQRLNFAIVNVKTEKLDINPESFMEGKTVAVKAGVNYGVDKEKHLVKVLFTNKFIHKDKEEENQQDDAPFIDLTVSCVFVLDPESWKKLVKEDENIFVLPHGLASHFGMLTASTARGVLHNETENTDYNKYIIPVNDVGGMISGNIQIPLNKDKSA